MTIELTKEEGQSLMQLLDLAVKAGGLNVATIALPLAQKLETAIQSNDNPN